MKVSVLDIDRPDHPALRGPGCYRAVRIAFLTGLLIGGTLGGVYTASRAIKFGLARRDMIDSVTRNVLYVGCPVGGIMAAVAFIRC